MTYATFDITLTDGSTTSVEDAHAYQQEQSMTTFFRNDGGRQCVDSWSVRVASFRTDQIAAIRRVDTADVAAGEPTARPLPGGNVSRLRSA